MSRGNQRPRLPPTHRTRPAPGTRQPGLRSGPRQPARFLNRSTRPLSVECKTLRHGRDEAGDDQQLYKLDSLGQTLRGVFGTTWMISARAPTRSMQTRARQHGIRLIGPDELPKLRDIVRHWKARPKSGS